MLPVPPTPGRRDAIGFVSTAYLAKVSTNQQTKTARPAATGQLEVSLGPCKIRAENYLESAQRTSSRPD